jgi:hypothetical protein
MLIERMWRAAMLQIGVYEEVERDESATSQAALVVLLVAVATAIGVFLSDALGGPRVGASGLVRGLVDGILSAFLGWVVWSYVSYFVGTRLFGGTATPGELLRTIGFAGGPGVLRIFAFVPVLGGLINFVVAIWLLFTGIVAIRQALDFSTGKAIGTAIIGWLALVLVALVVAVITGAIMAVLRL